MRKKTFMISIAFLILALVYGALSYPHEGDYKHMDDGGTNGIVMTSNCSYHLVWSIDDNADGEIDRCIGTFYNHEMFHVIPVQLIMEDGKPVCGCDAIFPSNGGGS